MSVRNFLRLLISCAALSACATPAPPANPEPLDSALKRLSREGAFSGAVVVRGANKVHFAHGYGWADPFAGHPFTAATPVDSASLAKPITAAAVLLLARERRVDLDAPVALYVSEFPHPRVTVRQLLTHAAGLPGHDGLEPLSGKTNSDLLMEMRSRRLLPMFAPGSAFSYCNTCYDSLALLIERVTGRTYLDFVKDKIGLPSGVNLRPQELAEWHGRAVGYRAVAGGAIERADSYESEAFYGSANLSVAADALAEWGAQWWSTLAPLRESATSPARIGEGVSGLTLGNWYCGPERTRCHYLGHHEGFHHMLYWDAERQLSIAMVTNNSLAPELQQRLQRAIVAFASGRSDLGLAELSMRLPHRAAAPGSYRTPSGEIVTIGPGAGPVLRLTRRGVSYDVYPVGNGIGYVPGLDLYVAGSAAGHLHLLDLYEDEEAQRLGTG